MSRYQKEPFKININGYGVFEAVAAEGIIRPKTSKSKRTMYNPKVRETVELYAQAYLRRGDWEWEIPDGMPDLQGEAEATTSGSAEADGESDQASM